MKPRLLLAGRIALAALILLSGVMLISWKKQEGGGDKKQLIIDTVPQPREKKVRDLDEALEQLDRIDLKAQIDVAMASVAEAMKQLDAEKLQMEVQKALQSVDMVKVKADMEKALKEIDVQKIQADVRASLEGIDWDEMNEDLAKAKLEIEHAKNVDLKEVDRELAKAREEIRKIQPELERELAKAKEEIEKVRPQMEKELAKAKVEIEKAKVVVREYKEFIDGLEKDGVLDTDKEYTIVHKDGKLIVNGKEVSSSVYNKYKSFLEKHKKLNIRKSENSLNLGNDDDDDDDK